MNRALEKAAEGGGQSGGSMSMNMHNSSAVSSKPMLQQRQQEADSHFSLSPFQMRNPIINSLDGQELKTIDDLIAMEDGGFLNEILVNNDVSSIGTPSSLLAVEIAKQKPWEPIIISDNLNWSEF